MEKSNERICVIAQNMENKRSMRMEDYIVRATAANNQIRAFAATTREMVETARSIITPALWLRRHSAVC